MERIFVLLFTATVFFSCSDDNRPLENPDYFQLRMVRESHQEGVPEYENPVNVGETIQLQEGILLDLSFVRRVKWSEREDRDVFDVRIELNDEGTQRFSDITRDNKGKRVAVFVAGELILVPTIMQQINDGRIPIFFNLSEENAKSWAEKINEQLGRRLP